MIELMVGALSKSCIVPSLNMQSYHPNLTQITVRVPTSQMNRFRGLQPREAGNHSQPKHSHSYSHVLTGKMDFLDVTSLVQGPRLVLR